MTLTFEFPQSQVMVNQNMVVGLPKVLPCNGFCKGCVLEKNH